ncbi:MAG: DUF1176 domain-containing protein, partial [Alphaproteobacteria bacterium]|nr:DUF1176 domain-containing protein [Alphaproteobacteria bacterium]
MRRIPLVLMTLGLASGLAACQGETGQTTGGAKAPDATPTASADPATVAPDSRTFSDWTVTCGNNGTCTAFGGVESGTGWLRIVMPAGPEAEPVVDLGMGMDADSLEPTVTIDGRAYGLDVVDGVARVSGDQARALIAALAGGRTATVGSG